MERRPFNPEPHLHLPCFRVAGDVGERFLYDAVGGRFDIGRTRASVQADVFKVYLYLRTCRVAPELPEQRGQQPQVVQEGGPEVQRQFTHVSDQLSNQILGFLHKALAGI